MRNYGAVATKFWVDDGTQALSLEAKCCALYLMTGPHTTMLGCFRLPDGYISADLNLSVEVIHRAFAELTTLGFLIKDSQSGWLWLPQFLTDNPIDNPNQAKSIERLFAHVPKNVCFMKALLAALSQHMRFLSQGFIDHLASLYASLMPANPSCGDVIEVSTKGFETLAISEAISSDVSESFDSVGRLVDNFASDLHLFAPGIHAFSPKSSDQPPDCLCEALVNPFETLAKEFRTQDQDQNQDQNQKQNQKQKKKKNKPMSGKPDVVSLEKFPKSSSSDKQAKSATLNVLHTQAAEVLNFLNQKTGKVYRPVDANLKLIVARLKSGATPGQCRQVIAKKSREWSKSDKMAEYLRPATLFDATKFEQYVGELVPMEGEL